MRLKPRQFRKPRRGHWATRGLVGLWLMNEGSGKQVFDLSGNGNTGTLGTSTSRTATKFGQGLSFPAAEDGTNYVTIAAKSSLRTDYITVVTWVKPGGASANTYGGIWYDQLNGTRNRILIGDNGLVAFQFTTADGDLNNWLGAGSVSMNEWSQVVFTWDGVSGRVYINGILVDTETEGGGVITKSSSDILIGAGQPAYYELDGVIDHQLVYNRALSAGEIAELYREPFGMFERDSIELWIGATSVGVAPSGIAVYTHHYQQQL